MWLWYQWKMWLQAFCALRSIPALPLALKYAWQRRAFFRIRSPPGQLFQLKTFGSSSVGDIRPRRVGSTRRNIRCLLSTGMWKEEKRAFNRLMWNISEDKVWMENPPPNPSSCSPPPTLLQLPWNDDSPLSHATNRDVCSLIYTCSLCLKVSAFVSSCCCCCVL